MRTLLTILVLVLSWSLGHADNTGDSSIYQTYPNASYGQDARQVMDVLVPNTTKAKPLLLLIHGGGWVGGDKASMSPIAEFFANNGYVVANINYRLASPGRNQYPTAEDDTKAALAQLKSMASTYQIDPGRIGVLGVSVGGYLAVQLGNTGLVQAVVDFYGPVNLPAPALLYSHYAGQPVSLFITTFLGTSPAADIALYIQASPVNSLTAQYPPTFIFHGDMDETVPLSQSQELYSKLRALGVTTQLEVVPNKGHGFLTNGPCAEWLDQCLGMLKPTLAP